MNTSHIPQRIIDLASEAGSSRNDDWTRKAAKRQLKETEEYIERFLADLEKK